MPQHSSQAPWSMAMSAWTSQPEGLTSCREDSCTLEKASLAGSCWLLDSAYQCSLDQEGRDKGCLVRRLAHDCKTYTKDHKGGRTLQ